MNKNRGWCKYCGAACLSKGVGRKALICSQCGSDMIPLNQLSTDDKAMVDMQDWFAEIGKKGLNGPSPVQAAEELGCHRTMIDRLVALKVLEKSLFEFKGQKVVIISRRSIDVAKQNRERTGNWTGYPVRKGA